MGRKAKVKFNDLEIGTIESKKFVKKTIKSFKRVAKRHCIENPEKYLALTDFNENSPIYKVFNEKDPNVLKNTDCKRYMFAQICYHLQNTPRAAGAHVNFSKNYLKLYKFFAEFDPEEFVNRYNGLPTINIFNDLEEALDKKNVENKVTVVAYCNAIYKFAKYISKMNKHADFISKLGCNSNDIDSLINNFISIDKKIGTERTHVGNAFACDTLKDFDEAYNFLSKPDMHVKETIDSAFALSFSDELDYVRIIKEIASNAKLRYKMIFRHNIEITPYVLDRMIYLIKSENFYLDKSIGDIYLEDIKDIFKQ